MLESYSDYHHMNNLDFLYLVIGIGVFIITLSVVVFVYEVVTTLRIIRGMLVTVRNTFYEIYFFKSTMKFNALMLIGKLLSFFRKGVKRDYVPGEQRIS